MADILIIGNGPAGISAALYAVRAGMHTTVIGKDIGALAKAGVIENYYGFGEPIRGEDLVANGIRQVRNAGVEVIGGEVVGIGYDRTFSVRTREDEYKAASLILATGSSRAAPKIPGLQEYEGAGVSYCATCDAFFYRGKDVAVLGSGEYAVHEAGELQHVARSVTILTNAQPMTAAVPEGILVDERAITAFLGDDILNQVSFRDGAPLDVSGVFVAIGVAGSTDLARKLGAFTEGTRITVDENMATSIPGLYAAGDCTGGLLQIAKAVYEGAKAGTEAVKYVRALRKTS